ncbi:outer membrane transport energization protein ExbB [Ruegeria halocynthiae]|uniref:Outer membrane transport energization protein ExbB n=1 Tax=Ruegeria halocynthiae TaxID=985054 RepID=A0A1H2XZV0_9RHOB|nr:MotA/TolQ/ExbB proton channel family protein [Ruegeria halocynthiae]SDW98245.1 outer membrane transport energization protein ExbB [Ruegeria halocynthiae]
MNLRMILLATLVTIPAPLAAQITQTEPKVSTQSPALADTIPSQAEVAAPTIAPAPLPVDATDAGLGETPTLLPPTEPLAPQQEVWQTAQDASERATAFLQNGGPSIWVIAALSVITAALILWKIWRLALIGAWSRGKAGQALKLFERGDINAALAIVDNRRGIRSKVVANAIRAIHYLPEDRAREETARVAKREIAQAGIGLRALELIATIAPLLGLLGTVLGMITAFQALQQAGNRADPALLAGGIWEALLTTAAGMAVAIPASAALTWFEAVIERIRRDVEDGATRLFVAGARIDLKLAAE